MKRLVCFFVALVMAIGMAVAQSEANSAQPEAIKRKVFVYTFEGGTAYDKPVREQVVEALKECERLVVVEKEEEAEFLVDGLVQTRRDSQKNKRSTDWAAFLYVTLVAGTQDGTIVAQKRIETEGKGFSSREAFLQAVSFVKDEVKKSIPKK